MNMDKRFFGATAVIGGLVVLAVMCGVSSSEKNDSSTNADTSYVAEIDDSYYHDDAGDLADYANEDGAEEVPFDESEIFTSADDTEDWSEEDVYEEVELDGIIGALVKLDDYNALATVQIITIDPETGEQCVFSEFSVNLARWNATDLDTTVRFALSYAGPHSGNHRNWFSEDYDKMIINRILSLQTYEQHAGWIDTSGNFFDVTEEIGANVESSFSDPNPIRHVSAGFEDDNFIFYEDFMQAEDDYYSVPISSVSEEKVTALKDRYGVYKKLSNRYKPLYPTSWFNNRECIAEYGTGENLYSVKVDAKTGETTEYLPVSKRVTWSGVLNPDKDSVAVLSAPEDLSDGVVEMYTVPLSGEEPEKVELQPNGSLLFDTTSVTRKKVLGDTLIKERAEWRFWLLEWR